MLAPGGAAAAAAAEGSLTPELEALSTPEIAEASPEEQAEALGLPAEGAGSLSREGERVVVEAHFTGGALARREALEEAGAKILVASREYQTVALSVEPEDLEAIAAVPGVDVVQAALRPQVYGVEGTATATVGTPAATCEGGKVISQGVSQLNVEAARADFGARGRGVTVGVLSDSFDAATKSEEPTRPLASKAKNDEISNDLPGPNNTCTGQGVAVRVLAEVKPSEELHDEGRAMLQVIHDLAPHAELAFATAYGSELEFARNIERLAEPVIDGGAGANVIVDDVAYYGEPFFQEGPVANAIRRVTEAGVTYLTAAGNNNLYETEERGGETFLTRPNHEIGSWERAEYDDTACHGAVAKLLAEQEFFTSMFRCLNFSPTGSDNPNFAIKVRPKAKLVVDLQWAEPWYGVHSDLDAYLVSADESKIIAPVAPSGPFDNVEEGGGVNGKEFSAPVEVLQWTNPSESTVEVKLVVDRCAGACNAAANALLEPRVKVGILENGSGVEAVEYHESMPSKGITVGPTVFGHAGSSAAITVGAVNYEEPSLEPKRPENYSSRGPFTAYFKPVSGTTPAEPLAEPEVISKPDITATDCAKTTFFAWFKEGTDAWEFCGTSESAPHAAAVAALMKQADPLASPRAIKETMEATATPFSIIKSKLAVGAGLLNAAKAMTVLTEPDGVTLDDPPSAYTGEKEPPHEEGKEGSGTETEKEKEKELPTPTPPAPTPQPAPVVSVTKGPASVDNEARPTFEFTASQQVNFTCQIDSAAPQPCSSPYVAPTALSDGQHGFAVVGTDSEGRSGASNTYYFTIDTKAPRARIVGHPAKLVKTGKATYAAHFKLTADESPVTFYCQMDREPLRICGERMTAKVKPGAHVLKVRAKDALGNTSATPSTFSFKVKKTPR